MFRRSQHEYIALSGQLNHRYESQPRVALRFTLGCEHLAASRLDSSLRDITSLFRTKDRKRGITSSGCSNVFTRIPKCWKHYVLAAQDEVRRGGRNPGYATPYNLDRPEGAVYSSNVRNFIPDSNSLSHWGSLSRQHSSFEPTHLHKDISEYSQQETGKAKDRSS